MPTRKIDRLTENSTDNKIRDAISACIRTEVRGGRAQDQAIAMCYDMARRKTGKSLRTEEKVARATARRLRKGRK